MKLSCGPTYKIWRAKREEWHRFFALWPRRVGDFECRWLEFIEKKEYLTAIVSIGNLNIALLAPISS